MTTLVPSKFFSNDIDKLLQYAVGFEPTFDRLGRLRGEGNYPPYNIIKTNDFNWEIEVALAGFKSDDVEVEVKDGVLEIRTKQDLESKEDDSNYTFKGIAKRQFIRTFSLGEDVVVQSAQMSDGMLRVHLERILPEDKKPRLIPITTN